MLNAQHHLAGALKQFGVAALYALLLYVGELYFEGEAIVGYFEPASGLALAALLIGGKRYVRGVFLGAILIHAMSGNSLWAVATIALADALQAFCGAWLLGREGEFDLRLQSLRGYLRLILLGGCASVALGALAVNTILLFSGLLPPESYFHSMIQWWMSDTLGVILVAPLILAWWRAEDDWRETGKKMEAILLIGLTVLAGQVVFLDWLHGSLGQAAKGYWIFLLAIWVAVRLGIRGTVIVSIVAAIQALLGAIQGTGFFAGDIAASQLANYWLYMLALSVTSMALSTYFTEHRRMEAALRNRTGELALHNHIFKQVGMGMPLCEILEDFAQRVEDQNPGMLCSIFLSDGGGDHPHHGAAPGPSDFCNQPVNDPAIGDGAGACGTAAHRGKRVIMADARQHACWEPFRDLEHHADAQFFQSQPIKGRDARIFGTLAVYRRKPAQPSDTETALVEHYADLAAQAIERARIRDDLHLKNLALNAAANAIVITDISSKIEWVNQAFGKLTGYGAAEATGRYPQELLKSGRHSQAYYGELWQTIISGEVWHGEIVNRRKDGSLYHEEMTITPVVNEQGEITHFVAVKQDITDRVEAERVLRRNKLIIDTVNDGFWMVDAMGNLLEANAVYAEMSGYSVDELVNMHITQLEATEQSVEEVRAHIEKVIEQGCSRFETRHRHKDGHEIDVEISATFMAEAQQFFVFIRDITGRKRTEAALRESEANQRAILDNSPYIAWLKDTDGRYIKVNKGYADYVRTKDIRQIIGKTDFDLWPKELAEKYRADDAEVIATRRQKHVEEQSLDGDRMHWVETFKTPVIDESGNMLGTTGFARDITGRKQMERSLRESEARFRAIIEASPVPFALNDEQQNITYLNSSFVRTFGYTPDDIPTLAEWWPKAYPDPAYRQWVAATWQIHLERAKRENEPFEPLELDIRCKGGGVRTALVGASPIGASFAGIHLVSLYDITERKQAEQVLVESESRFREIFDTVNDAIFIHEAETGRIVDINRRMCEMYGLTREEALACDVNDLSAGVPPYSAAEAVEKIRLAYIGDTQIFDWLARARDGHLFWVEVSLRFALIGSHRRILAVVRDISERKRVEEELRIAAIAFDSNDGMMIADANRVILRINHAFTEITGYTAQESVGQSPHLLGSGRHDAGFYAAMWKNLRQGGAWKGEIWSRRKNGEVYPAQFTITAVKGDTGEVTHYVATLHDISERKAAEEEINNLAFYDTLTQLPNRRMLDDRLGQAMAASKRSGRYGALMFLDLDNFKPLNDTHGHGVGDLLLIEAARRLAGCVRETDTVARFGGDEFVVMLGELDEDEAESAAQAGIVAGKIRAALDEPYLLALRREGEAERTVEHRCTASIGVALFFGHEAGAEDIVKWADIAMYQAKGSGRNSVCFFEA